MNAAAIKIDEVDRHPMTVEELGNPLRKRQVKLSASKLPFKYGLDDESVDVFSQKFKDEIRNINDTLDLIEEAFEKNRNCLENMGVDEKKIFTSFSEEIRELEKYLTASTRFLPDYKVKTCQQLLSDLTNRYNGVRRRVLPKKKFEFNARKKKDIVAAAPLKNVSTETERTSDNREREELQKERKVKENAMTCKISDDLSLDISGLTGKYVSEEGNRINKHDVMINDLKNCFVEIRGHPGSIRLKNLVNCVILCGPTTFSIYGEGCHQTTFAIACHQFRLHCSSSCTLFLHVTSRAIIEECNGIEIGTYNYKYNDVEQDFKDAGLDIETNNYSDVADFDWLSPDAPSPNWKLTDKRPNWDELRKQFKEDKNKDITK